MSAESGHPVSGPGAAERRSGCGSGHAKMNCLLPDVGHPSTTLTREPPSTFLCTQGHLRRSTLLAAGSAPLLLTTTTSTASSTTPASACLGRPSFTAARPEPAWINRPAHAEPEEVVTQQLNRRNCPIELDMFRRIARALGGAGSTDGCPWPSETRCGLFVVCRPSSAISPVMTGTGRPTRTPKLLTRGNIGGEDDLVFKPG
jgi:hypothetical protein